MNKSLVVLREQIEIMEATLKELRKGLRDVDTNNPYSQVVLAQKITVAAAKLDALKHLRKSLRGIR